MAKHQPVTVRRQAYQDWPSSETRSVTPVSLGSPVASETVIKDLQKVIAVSSPTVSEPTHLAGVDCQQSVDRLLKLAAVEAPALFIRAV